MFVKEVYMVYSQSGILKDVKPWSKMFVAGAAAVTLAVGMFAAASAAHSSTGCSFTDSTEGTMTTWSLNASCTTTAPINVPTNTTLEGNGNTISANFVAGPSGSGVNTVIGVVGADNVTINDLTVDGTGGTGLHGINVYESTGVVLNDVTTKNNDKSGLVVNGSEVTVKNITTSGNMWHGINVAQGSGVTMPSVLTVTGNSTQSDAAQLYLDDVVGQNVTVVDVNNQYVVSEPVTNPDRPNDRLYTLKAEAFAKDACKNGGFNSMVNGQGTAFKNQGQCVAYVQSSDNSKHRR